MVAEGVGLHHLHGLQLLQAGLFGDFVFSLVRILLKVADVCDVAHVTHLVAEMTQQLAEDIIGDSGAGVTEMGIAVYCRAADVHADAARVDRFEKLLVPGEGIGKFEWSHRLQR